MFQVWKTFATFEFFFYIVFSWVIEPITILLESMHLRQLKHYASPTLNFNSNCLKKYIVWRFPDFWF